MIRPPIAPIAPGLAVYRVAIANAYDTKLEDETHTVVGTVKPARRGGDALPAPKPGDLVHRAAQPPRRQRRERGAWTATCRPARSRS